MTIEVLTTQYRIPLLIFMILSPWVAYFLCIIIPGKTEEPYILSANLFVSAIATLIFCVYLTFSLNRYGFRAIGREADLFLLISVPYHLILSINLSKKRLRLSEIPAFRIIRGGIIISIAFFILTSILDRVRIYFFSYMPFNTFLIIVGVVLFIGYLGWLEIFGDDSNELP